MRLSCLSVWRMGIQSRVNTAEANSLNINANICRDFGSQPLQISRITVMEHGHVFSQQWRDKGNQSLKGQTSVAGGEATMDRLSCSSLGNSPQQRVTPPQASASCSLQTGDPWSSPGAICHVGSSSLEA